MDLVQRAIQHQQCSAELLDLLRLDPPLSPRLLQLQSSALATALSDQQQYHRLFQGYVQYAQLMARTSGSSSGGTSGSSNGGTSGDAQSLEVIDALLEICAGFNYAFDHWWMLPLAKQIYTTTVHRALRLDREWEQKQQHVEQQQQSTSAFGGQQQQGSNHPEKVKAVCVLLDALRAKMMDRQSFPQSKKAGILFTLNLIFRCYLRIHNMKQMQKVLDYVFTHVLPGQQLSQELSKWFPRSERATYHFFMGKFLLTQHNVPGALEHLEQANRLCPKTAAKNKRLISIYWVVANLVDGKIPARQAPLWQQDPLQAALFQPLLVALRAGSIQHFYSLLADRQSFWSRLGLYDLLVTRTRMILNRNLARRIFVVASGIVGSATFGYGDLQQQQQQQDDSMMQDDRAGGPSAGGTVKAPPRISLDDLCVAWCFAGDPAFTDKHSITASLTTDSASYFGWENMSPNITSSDLVSMISVVARLIDCGLMKGYVNASNRCVVVSRKQAFPPLHASLRRLMEREEWWCPVQMDRGIVEAEDDDD